MMKGFNRLTIRAALVLTMALGGGLLGAGCDTDENGGEAGSGGSVNEGGTGGTINEGGSGGEGQGGSGGTTTPKEPNEYDNCDAIGTTFQLKDGGMLFCDNIFTDGQARWLRVCLDSGECKDSTTFCGNVVTGEQYPYCLLNTCGDDPNFQNTTNGDLFEACDTNIGIVSDGTDSIPREQLNGTCLPLARKADGSAFAICVKGGEIEAGGTCGDEDARDLSTLCAQGTACAVPSGKTEGTCTDVCDAVDTETGAEFASCQAGEVCGLAMQNPPTNSAIGFCGEDDGTEEPGTGETGDDEEPVDPPADEGGEG